MHNNRIIQLTEDGSHTFSVPAMNVTYHSTHGAIQESMHVFIKTGFEYFIEKSRNLSPATIKVFEMGFGTGLNALLTLQHAILANQKMTYETIEPYPLSINEIESLNYTALIGIDLKQCFYTMHQCEWNKAVEIHPLFSFQKIKTVLEQFQPTQKFHIIYFDAFDPNAQPGLWTEDVFKKMFGLLYPNGILVTYCSKGVVRRAMQAAGFKVEKLSGPPGKREIVRAIKPHQS